MADFPAVFDLSTLDGTNGFRIDGIAAGDKSGSAVATGDINGDGIDDIVIGAPYADPDGAIDAGGAYVLYGSAAGFDSAISLTSLDGTNGFALFGSEPFAHAGEWLASGQDLDGDGRDEILVAAPRADPNGNSQAGEVHSIMSSDIALVVAAYKLAELLAPKYEGIEPFDRFGYAVQMVGDINGDGIEDFVIGAPFANPADRGNAGSVYVVFGTAQGFPDVGPGDLDGSNGFEVRGASAGDYAGVSIAAIADFNGDGLADIAIGASGSDPNGENGAGRAYIVYGSRQDFPEIVELAELGDRGTAIDGKVAFDVAGVSVAGAGDINGDGFADLAVGVPGADYGYTDPGAIYVVFGRAGGRGQSFDPATLDGTNGFRIVGFGEDRLGTRVASAGDVNGDGFDDLMVSAPYSYERNQGFVAVIFGKAGGFSPTVDLLTLNGRNGYIILGVHGGDKTGNALASGDVNGDGFSDVVIGAENGDAAGDPGGGGRVLAAFDTADAGETYVVFGRAPTTAVTRIGSAAGQTIRGGVFDDILSGRGGNDILFGGAGRDRLDGGRGHDRLNGGAGLDTASYALAAAGVRLNLGAAGAQNTGGGGVDTLVGIEYGVGSRFADVLRGKAAGNRLEGGGGDDRLYGLSGRDALHGDGGDDLLDGGAGLDMMRGGAGDDLYRVDDAGDKAIEAADEGHDQVHALADHVLAANVEDLRLFGTALVGTGNPLGNGILGNGADNVLSGLGGNDILRGQGGTDALHGGGGADIFMFDDGDSHASRSLGDRIADFSRAEGDRINLRRIDADVNAAADQNFAFLGTAAFTGAAGELRCRIIQGDAYVSGDVNGDAVADFFIRIDNVAIVDAADFVL